MVPRNEIALKLVNLDLFSTLEAHRGIGHCVTNQGPPDDVSGVDKMLILCVDCDPGMRQTHID